MLTLFCSVGLVEGLFVLGQALSMWTGLVSNSEIPTGLWLLSAKAKDTHHLQVIQSLGVVARVIKTAYQKGCKSKMKKCHVLCVIREIEFNAAWNTHTPMRRSKSDGASIHRHRWCKYGEVRILSAPGKANSVIVQFLTIHYQSCGSFTIPTNSWKPLYTYKLSQEHL